MSDHPTDYCLILQGETSEMVYAVGTFPGPPQMPYNTYSNACNPGWRVHPSFTYVQNQWPNPSYQPYQPPKSSLESLVERLEQSQEKFQNRTKLHIHKLEKQMCQLAKTVGRLESQGKLPSQTITNPKENVGIPTPKPEQSPYDVQPLFPSRFIKEDKQGDEKGILDAFCKVEFNISLLEVIWKMPRYTHFLRELRANTRKLYMQEKVNLEEHVSGVLIQWLSPKLKDQGMFDIPRKIHKISLKEVLSWTKRKSGQSCSACSLKHVVELMM
ncbi:hypothetical protein GQ457_09G016100 [Hibiscus cannabinus]